MTQARSWTSACNQLGVMSKTAYETLDFPLCICDSSASIQLYEPENRMNTSRTFRSAAAHAVSAVVVRVVVGVVTRVPSRIG